MIKKGDKNLTTYMIISILMQVFAILVYPTNHYFTSLILIIKAIILYFFIVIKVAQYNWLDIRAIFSAVWFATLGLASLRLVDYQKEWSILTWIYLEVGYIMLQIGCVYGRKLVEYFFTNIESFKGRCNISFATPKTNKLFWMCTIVSLVGIVCFCINVYIKGFIPFFSSSETAYLDFYTKFHIFAVASTMISGPCYYCIKKGELSIIKKIVMWMCILFATFLFPTLVVSRGTFITSALGLMTAIFYLNKKKLWVLILSVVAIFSIYAGLSVARGYTEAQLAEIFEPSKITVGVNNNETNSEQLDNIESTEDVDSTEIIESTEDVDSTEIIESTEIDTELTEENTQPEEMQPQQGQVITFALPGQVAYLYSYLTVSHDNFNEAVVNVTDYTHGAWQLSPFNVILRIEKINQIISSNQIYLVRPHLNTNNLFGYAYYDGGLVAMCICAFLWGVIFMSIQVIHEKTKGIFSLWALGNTMTPVIMCFFASWMSVFSHWMHWGVVFVIWLIMCINIRKGRVNEK